VCAGRYRLHHYIAQWFFVPSPLVEQTIAETMGAAERSAGVSIHLRALGSYLRNAAGTEPHQPYFQQAQPAPRPSSGQPHRARALSTEGY
jgi:hypothetical protein